MKNDPVIERIRKARKQISQSVSHDPKKLVKHYQEMQAKYADRLIDVGQMEKQSV